MAACLYDKNGIRFGEYVPWLIYRKFFPSHPPADGHLFTNDYLEVISSRPRKTRKPHRERSIFEPIWEESTINSNCTPAIVGCSSSGGRMIAMTFCRSPRACEG